MDKYKNESCKFVQKTARQVARAAEEILESYGIQIPVHVVTIAESLGITVRLDDLEDEVSGILIMQPDKNVMAVNENHPEFRRRFTMAHEIGHFVLHSKRQSVFIDDAWTFHRNKEISKQDKQQESEANLFAANLLMPAVELRMYLERKPLNPNDEPGVTRMAKYFRVSPQALKIQLEKLKLV
jgi:Zn-dependent peptidase ImmA (M78 family)